MEINLQKKRVIILDRIQFPRHNSSRFVRTAAFARLGPEPESIRRPGRWGSTLNLSFRDWPRVASGRDEGAVYKLNQIWLTPYLALWSRIDITLLIIHYHPFQVIENRWRWHQRYTLSLLGLMPRGSKSFSSMGIIFFNYNFFLYYCAFFFFEK